MASWPSAGRCTGVVIAAAAALFLASPAAGRRIETKALRVTDLNTRTLVVRLDPTGTTAGREAAVGLVVRNRLAEPRRVRVRFASSGRPGRYIVYGTAASPRASTEDEVNLATARGLVIPVSGRDLVNFNITFEAVGDAPAEDLAGRLLIFSERSRGRRLGGSPVVLRIRGVRSEERTVTISPKSVTLPVTRDRIAALRPPALDEQDVGTAYVDLSGPGAAAYARRGLTATIVVRRDDGKSIRVPIAVTPGRDNTSELTIPDKDVPVEFDAPGRYEGTLPLGSGSESPKVKLVVTVREWWGWAIIAVLLGVLLGRMFPPFLKRQRMRKRSRQALRDAVARFGAARRGRTEPAAYDLDAIITPDRWRLRGLFTRPQDEIARMLAKIDAAETDPDYEECNREAEGLRARVDRWAQVERAARRLRRLLDEEVPKRPAKGEFSTTAAHTDAMSFSWYLTAPLKADQATEAVSRVDRECKVLKLSIEIWRRQARLDERIDDGSPADLERRELELDKLWGTPGDPTRRGLVTFAKLGTTLESANRQLRALEREHPRRIIRAGSSANPWRRRFAAWVNRDLARGARILAMIWQGLRVALAVVVGWMVRVVGTTITRISGWLAVAEALSLLLALTVPAAVYILGLYDEDWGSPLDVLTAFAAGFVGKLALDFGAGGITVGFSRGTADEEKKHGPGKEQDERRDGPATEQPQPKAPEPSKTVAEAAGESDPGGGSVPQPVVEASAADRGDGPYGVYEVPGLPLLVVWSGREPLRIRSSGSSEKT